MVNESGRRVLIDLLEDAHAMEEQSARALERQSELFAGQRQVRERLQRHAKETQRQAERLERCLQSYDVRKPGNGSRFAQSVRALGSSDGELLKDAIAGLAIEHVEIACYRSLAAAAEDLGEREAVDVCAEILKEEEAMAQWLEEHLEEIVHERFAEGEEEAARQNGGQGKTSGNASATKRSSGSRPGAIDLNEASTEEIQEIEGIGPSLAAAIVGFRDKRGRLEDFDDLREIDGFNETMIAKLRSSARIG